MKKTIEILLLIFCFCANAIAQNQFEFSVAGFDEKPFDTSATDARYKLVDGNGELFSIIKLVSTAPDDDLSAYALDFGMCEGRKKVVDGEVWWYVQRNAMRATIRRDGFKTVKYEFNTTVEPGKVYEIRLSTAPRVVKKRYLMFKIRPAGSKANIQYRYEHDAEYRTFATGQVDADGNAAEKLLLGRYYYKITSKYYHTSEGVVELTDALDRYVEEVTLRPNYGTLALSVASNADIYIDGEKVGRDSWNGILLPGSYVVETALEHHRNSMEYIEIKEGETKNILLKSPVPITGSIDLNSSPLEAEITIDGKKCGTTPMTIDALLIGEHKVTISKSGYSSEHLTVTVKEGECAELNVALAKLASNNSGQLTGNVSAADGTINGHEYVDLGLSIKWATCNVGATRPEEYGGYYAWGEVEEKNDHSWGTYKWDRDNVDSERVLELQNDVAHVEWGGSWRMPTRAELDELCKKCQWEWITINGVNGCKVTSKKNGNSIFLPAAGYCIGTSVYSKDGYGCYWSASLRNSDNAYGLCFHDDGYSCYDYGRYSGRSVRPVVSLNEKKKSSASTSAKTNNWATDDKNWKKYFNFGLTASLGYGGIIEYSSIGGKSLEKVGLSGDIGALLRIVKPYRLNESYIPVIVGMKYQFAGTHQLTLPMSIDIGWAPLYIGVGYEPTVSFYQGDTQLIHNLYLRCIGVATRHHDFNVYFKIGDFDLDNPSMTVLGCSYTYYF